VSAMDEHQRRSSRRRATAALAAAGVLLVVEVSALVWARNHRVDSIRRIDERHWVGHMAPDMRVHGQFGDGGPMMPGPGNGTDGDGTDRDGAPPHQQGPDGMPGRGGRQGGSGSSTTTTVPADR
jgi:hypothetical protein